MVSCSELCEIVSSAVSDDVALQVRYLESRIALTPGVAAAGTVSRASTHSASERSALRASARAARRFRLGKKARLIAVGSSVEGAGTWEAPGARCSCATADPPTP